MSPIENPEGTKIYPAQVYQFKSGKYQIVKSPKCPGGAGKGSRHVLDSSLPRDLSGNGWIVPRQMPAGIWRVLKKLRNCLQIIERR